MPLYEDKLMSDTAVDPTTASPLLAQPGIGIAPVQNAAPQQIPMKQDLRSDAISKMGGVQKFLAALGEFGAGYQGSASPIDTQIAQEQQAKFQKMQEWGMKFDLGKKVHDESLTLTGDTRKAYLDARAKELDILEPNLGNSVRLFADEPGLLDAFQKSMPKMPAAIQTLVKTNPQAFFQFQKDHPAEFIKMVRDAEQQTNLDEASTKLRKFSIPDQFLPEVKGGKLTASQFQKIQEALPEGNPGKLTPENWKAINSSDASQTLFYQSAGIMSPKDEAEVAKKSYVNDAPTTRTIQSGNQKITQEWVNGKWNNVAISAEKSPAQLNKEERDLIKADEKAARKDDATRKAIGKADLVIGKVDDALEKVGFFTTGLTGAILSNLPGTKSYDLDKTVDTIKANIGFQELADMRAASPTGGALGQIAVKELDFLQAAISSLDSGLSQDEKKKNLEQIKTHYVNWKNAVGNNSSEQPPSEIHESLPDPKKYSGKIATDTKTGIKYKSNGTAWVKQ